MKKILSILFLFTFALCSFAQERTVNVYPNGAVDLSATKTVSYVGTTLDRLIPTTRDTIDFYLKISDNYKLGPLNYNIAVKMSPIAGADTTVSVTVLGKKTAAESYGVLKAAATTSAVTSTLVYSATSIGNINPVDTTGLKYYTSQKANTLLYYKYIMVRLILKGNDSVGTGIKVDRIDFQFD